MKAIDKTISTKDKIKVLLLAPNIELPPHEGGGVHLIEVSRALSKMCKLKVLCNCGKDFKEKEIEFYHTSAGRFSLLDIRKIWKLAKDVDIIHSRIDPFEIGGLIVAKILKKPIIGEVNGNFLAWEKRYSIMDFFFPFIYLVLLLWLKLIVSRVDRIICLSESNRKSLIKHGLDKRKIEVVKIGGNPDRFKKLSETEIRELRKKLSLPNGLIVLLMGRLAPVEGLDRLFNINLKDVHFLIIGGKRKYKKYVEKLKKKAKDNFIFIDSVPYEEIKDYILASDIVIAPLRESSNKEEIGWCPIKILEAMAAAKPTIVSDVSGIREILSDREGIITNNFAEAIQRLRDKNLREKKGKAAREKIEKELSWDHTAQKLVRIYNQEIRRKLESAGSSGK